MFSNPMSTATTNPDSDLRLAIEPYDTTAFSAAAATLSELTIVDSNPKRKKRSKVIRSTAEKKPIDRKPSSSSSAKREKMPEITMPCSECGKRFWSWKALFGHMRCHPERQWRGINPPSNLRLRPPLMLRSPDYDGDGDGDEDNEAAASLLLLANSTPFDRFECSSCKKVFGSHQALGGHRASHKNVKGCFAAAIEDLNGGVLASDQLFRSPASASTQQQHKCGICLRIFSSGQALGGHKRCHWERGSFSGEDDCAVVQPLSMIRGLDLNMPPMEDDYCHHSSSSSSMALDLRLRL